MYSTLNRLHHRRLHHIHKDRRLSYSPKCSVCNNKPLSITLRDGKKRSWKRHIFASVWRNITCIDTLTSTCYSRCRNTFKRPIIRSPTGIKRHRENEEKIKYIESFTSLPPKKDAFFASHYLTKTTAFYHIVHYKVLAGDAEKRPKLRWHLA